MKILEDCSAQELIDELLAREEHVGLAYCVEIGTLRRKDVVTAMQIFNRVAKQTVAHHSLTEG